MEELQILLPPNKEHKKVFSEVPIVGFRNGKSYKDYLVRAALSKMGNAGGSKPCGKGTAKACGEVFKIEGGPLNCNSEKVLYLLRCKICNDNSYVRKAKTKFRIRFNNYEINTYLFENENRMHHRSVFIHTKFKNATEVLMIGK